VITTKTVFILGAGASKPYQYPLGTELVDNIKRMGLQTVLDVYLYGKDDLEKSEIHSH